MALDSGRPHALAAMVDYQEGSVVSRQLFKTGSGTATVFAFAKGEGLSEHTTPHDALLLVLDGAAEVTVAGTSTTCSTGEIVLLPANEPHAVQAREGFKMLLLMYRSADA